MPPHTTWPLLNSAARRAIALMRMDGMLCHQNTIALHIAREHGTYIMHSLQEHASQHGWLQFVMTSTNQVEQELTSSATNVLLWPQERSFLWQILRMAGLDHFPGSMVTTTRIARIVLLFQVHPDSVNIIRTRRMAGSMEAWAGIFP